MKLFPAVSCLLLLATPALAQSPATAPSQALSAQALGQMLAEAQFREAYNLTRALAAEQALTAADSHVTALEDQVKVLTPKVPAASAPAQVAKP